MKKLIAFTGSRTGPTSAQQKSLGEVIRLNAPDQIEALGPICQGAEQGGDALR